jgi:hypothetical protein
MDNMKDGGSANRPSVLVGSNYDYWKARMIAFLKSMDNKSWKAVVKGWTHPIISYEYGKWEHKLEARRRLDGGRRH